MFDADSANTSGLYFSIVGGADVDDFYMDSHKGILFPNVDFKQRAQKQYEVLVNVSDDWGQGYTDQTKVKVHSSLQTLWPLYIIIDSTIMTFTFTITIH